MKRSLVAEFVLLAAVWGSSFLFMRTGASAFGPLATAGLRVLVASMFLLPILWWSGHAGALRENLGRILVVGLLNSGIPFVLFGFAVLSINTGLAAILNATVPLFGALVAWVWLGDRPGRWRAIGLIVGFAGVAVLSWDKASFHSGGSGWAVLACLGATICYALAASYTRRFLSGIPPLATATGSQLGAMLGLALPAIWAWPAGPIPLAAWGSIGVLGVVCTGLAYISYFRLLERAGPSRALTVTFLIPVFAVFYGAVLLGEPVNGAMLLGALVVLAGVALSTGLWPRRQPVAKVDALAVGEP